MLTCSDVYNLLLDELRTDVRGLSCEVDTFNRLIRLVNQEYYDEVASKFESDEDNIDTLGWLKVHNYSITLTSGVGTLPGNYQRLIGKPRTLDGTTYRNVDLVSEFEHGSRLDDFLTQPTVVHPVCRIGGINANELVQIRVTPTTITNVWIDYIKTVTVPFLDYYLSDTTYNITFLAETATPQSLPAGYTYRTGTVGGAGVTVTSQTVNLDWDENDLSALLSKLVYRVGKQYPDAGLVETSMAEQAKAEAND
jgi:hypothetical protein